MSNPVTISPRPPVIKSMNYELLRTQGLQYIEKVASQLWTDYNVHDPGITLLELLCYAITDLGYRTAMPVKDLLATKTDNKLTFQQQFYSAAQILPNRPVTVNDYRKLFIDIPGIKNAWIRKAVYTLYYDAKTTTLVATPPLANSFTPIALNGIYDVLLELDALTPEEEDTLTPGQIQDRQDALILLAREAYHRNRNLCEDLGSITLIPEQRIQICADIEIKAEANSEEVMAEVLFGIQQYLSPLIRQYTLAEMLELKYPMDEIFEGPYLINGFLPDKALEESVLRTHIYSSDIIGIVMDIPGVVSVKEILLNYCDMPNGRHEWCLPVAAWHKPTLCLDKAAIHFFKDVIPVTVKKDIALDLLNEKINVVNKLVKSSDYDYGLGRYMDVADYTPLLHQLPVTYGVGPFGLPAQATEERRAIAKQLKGYLLFFDQVLANYLAQLSNVRSLFRVQFSDAELTEDPHTYFFQKIKAAGFPGIEELLKDYATFELPGVNHLPELINSYDKPVERSNRFLDHLLSRFAERFSDYVMQLYSLYGQKAAEDVLVDKKVFLNEYPVISRDRSAGFDYFNQDVTVWDTDNVSGMEHRIARLIGIPNYNRRVISVIKYEIYQELDADGKDEFRFRLIDPVTNKILLSSSHKYSIREDCEIAFKTAMRLCADGNNYSAKLTSDGKHYFNVTENGNVIARRIEYFETAEQMDDAIDFLMAFVRKNYSDEGFFVVEHILLRPDVAYLKTIPGEAVNPDNFLPVCADKDCDDGCAMDPYSFRITVILPANTARFRETGFREYIEKLIRMETPAHVQPKICWLNDTELGLFESAFRTWLELKQQEEMNTPEGLAALQELIKILYQVKSIYPVGELSDCASPSQTPILLGRTNLGNQNA